MKSYIYKNKKNQLNTKKKLCCKNVNEVYCDWMANVPQSRLCFIQMLAFKINKIIKI